MSLKKSIFSRLWSNKYTRPGIRLLSRKNISLENAKFIFLIGCYNSGTTLLRDILANSEQIDKMFYEKEGVHYTDALPIPDTSGFDRLWVHDPKYPVTYSLGNTNFKNLKRDWECLYPADMTKYKIEKSITNLTRLKWLLENFQCPKFVHIKRDPVAVIEGILRQAKPKENNRVYYNVDSCIAQLQDAYKLLEIFKAEKEIDLFEIEYEELCTNTKLCLQDICNFLSIDDGWIERELYNHKGEVITIQNKNETSYQNLTEDDINKIKTIFHSYDV